jgi:hypothetical protein
MNSLNLSALLMALVIVGCTTPQVIHYKNPNPSSSDVPVTFRSDLNTHIYFMVNGNPSEVCANFKNIGYVLNMDSIFLYDKPNKEINLSLPSGKPIGVASWHKYDDPGQRSNCFPPSRLFTPEAGEKYEVRMSFINVKGTDGMCKITVDKLIADGTKVPVSTSPYPDCKKN